MNFRVFLSIEDTRYVIIDHQVGAEFSKSTPVTLSSCRLYNYNHVKDTQGHIIFQQFIPWSPKTSAPASNE